MSFKLIAMCVVLLSICSANADSNADLVNKKVERTIDLTSHLVYITHSVEVENTAKSGAEKSYTFIVEPSLAKHVSVVTAQLKGPKAKAEDMAKRKLNVVKLAQNFEKGQMYKIEFKEDLAASKSLSFEIEMTLFEELKPYPNEITQLEKQLVLYTGNHYYYSLYLTKRQNTVVNLASEKTESYSQLKPVQKSDSTIKYGPYDNIKPFEKNEMKVHYENNSPFLRVNNLHRTIEVSHWGNIAVEEVIDLFHYGAELKGPFSRFDYMRKQGGAASIESFHTLLPSLASDVYYRDEIGNISTSNLRKNYRSKISEPLDLELRPRFPLFGGWRTHYTIGYNLPTYQYLFKNGNDYLLKMKLIDHIYVDQYVETATIKIILPEHCTDLEFVAPYTVDRAADQVHYTYLDTVGRPVIVIHMKNTVDSHIQDFQLRYKFQKMMILKEPFLVMGAFFLVFMFVIIIVRIDFSISTNKTTEHAKKE